MNVLKVLTLFIFSIPLFAGVNKKNGNFYISYTDLIMGGGSLIEITRTYNSKSTERGIFGNGWGSDLETRLVVNNDGTVTVFENGSGEQRTYFPKNEDANPQDTSRELVNLYKELGVFSANEEYEKALKNYIGDAESRNSLQSKMVNSGLLEPIILPLNSRLDIRYGNYIIKTLDGYTRHYGNGISESFDKNGFYIEMRKGKKFFLMRRNKQGQILEMVDHLNNRVQFFNNVDGTIREIRVGKKKATFKYQNRRLMESTDVAENNYKFTYDDNFNMTSIKYVDASKMEMTYDAGTQYVNKVVRRNKYTQEYDYFKKNRYNFGTAMRVLDPESNLLSEDKETFIIKKVKSGYEYTAEILRENREGKIQQFFDPLQNVHMGTHFIKNGVQELYEFKKNFIYKKVTEKYVETYTKKENRKRIGVIQRTYKDTGQQHLRTFEYNVMGYLTEVKSSKNLEYIIEYEKGELSKLKSTKNEIEFSFDNEGQSTFHIGNKSTPLKNLETIDEDIRAQAQKYLIEFLNLIQYPKPVCVNYDVHHDYKIFSHYKVLEELVLDLVEKNLILESLDNQFPLIMSLNEAGIFNNNYSSRIRNLNIQLMVNGNKNAENWCLEEMKWLVHLERPVALEYLKSNNLESAERWYEKALITEISYMKELMLICHWYCQVKNGKPNTKISEYLSDLDWKTERFSLKQLRFINGQISEEDFLRLAVSNTDKSKAYYTIAISALSKGEEEKARSYFQKIPTLEGIDEDLKIIISNQLK